MRFPILASALVFAIAPALASPALADEEDPEAMDGGDPEFVDIDMPDTLPLPVGGDIYLRVDAAYRLHQRPGGDLTGFGAIVEADLGDAAAVGFGAGYRLGDHLRMDATVDYGLAAGFSGSLPCPGCGSLQAEIEALTGLLNLYADLGSIHGISPYLGAGLGATWLRTSDVSGPAGRGGDELNLAFALSAGIGYRLSDSLTVDVGYRYLDLGEGEARASGSRVGFDVSAHEIRVGLRYGL